MNTQLVWRLVTVAEIQKGYDLQWNITDKTACKKTANKLMRTRAYSYKTCYKIQHLQFESSSKPILILWIIISKKILNNFSWMSGQMNVASKHIKRTFRRRNFNYRLEQFLNQHWIKKDLNSKTITVLRSSSKTIKI